MNYVPIFEYFAKNYKFILLLCLIVGCSESSKNNPTNIEEITGYFIDDWTYSIDKDTRDVSEFRLWLPEHKESVRAILVLSHSNNSNGLGLVNSKEWQAFATKENLCILALHFKSIGSSVHYSDAFSGSGKELLFALDKLTQKHDVLYINDLPFLLAGYSAGGVFSYNFTQFQKDRVIAFANIRGGGISTPIKWIHHIPVLFLAGALDHPSRNETLQRIALENRSLDGNWVFATEPNVDHFGGMEASYALIQLLFSKALALRLPSPTSTDLENINTAFGWLGNYEDFTVYSYENYPNNKEEAAWLVDEVFAKAWVQYQTPK